MFVLRDGYLYYGKQLCISQKRLCEFIIRGSHEGGLAGYFGQTKTLHLVQENFYWPKMVRDVNKLVERCETCIKAKMHKSNSGL